MSSKASRWIGSRTFSLAEEEEPCSWWKQSRENVLSITSSMYLRIKHKKGCFQSLKRRKIISETVCDVPQWSLINYVTHPSRPLTSPDDGSKKSSPPSESRSSVGSGHGQTEEMSSGVSDRWLMMWRNKLCTCFRRRLTSGLFMSMTVEPDGKLSLWVEKLDSTVLAERRENETIKRHSTKKKQKTVYYL